MTYQDVINTVWQAFFVERRPLGWNEADEICVYHGQGGVSCAIGILDTHKVLEGVVWPITVGEETGAFADSIGLGSSRGRVFLLRVQQAHDNSCIAPETPSMTRRELFRQKLLKVIQDYALERPAVPA